MKPIWTRACYTAALFVVLLVGGFAFLLFGVVALIGCPLLPWTILSGAMEITGAEALEDSEPVNGPATGGPPEGGLADVWLRGADEASDPPEEAS